MMNQKNKKMMVGIFGGQESSISTAALRSASYQVKYPTAVSIFI